MNILKNPLFWLPVLVAALVAGFFYSKNKNNISSPKNNNSFVQTANIDNSSIDITLLGSQIGQTSFKADYSITQATKLIKSMGDQINADIFGLMENSLDRAGTLDGYLALAGANVSEAKNISAGLKSQATALQKISTDCQKQKDTYDKNFYNGLKINEAEYIVKGYEGSKKAGSCYMENRIQANAYSLLGSKLDSTTKLLSQKYDLLNKNKTLIAENYQLFKSNNLEQLLQVKNSFKNLGTTSTSTTNTNDFGIKFPSF